MDDESLSFTFSVVSSARVAQAYAFHEGLASSDEHIFPRTREQLRAYAELNQLFGAQRTETEEFVGLCYANRESDDEPFEVGGLTVADSYQKTGIGTFLVQFALAHVMVYDDPWSTGQDVIAHVHEHNDDPRRLLEKLAFEFVETKEYPGDAFPESMKRNADGNVVGDVFRFTRAGLTELARWFANDFQGRLRGGATVVLQLGPVRVEDFVEGLRDLARSYPPPE